jgi:hypothetical protein
MTRNATLRAAALLVLALAAHGRSVTNGFIWDDDYYVTHNGCLHTLAGLQAIWADPSATPQYYPLVHTTYWLEYHLWGLDPAGYHAVNVLLHVGSTLLLYQVFRRLGLATAGLAAALFAAHPLGVESVGWITERKNTLSLCFALLATLAWLEYRFAGDPRELLRRVTAIAVLAPQCVRQTGVERNQHA